MRVAGLGTAVAGSVAAAAVAWTLGGAQASSAATAVCAGPDRILRAVDGTGCPGGQQRIDLPLVAASGILQSPDDTPPVKSDTLGYLERRVDEIQFGPLFAVFDSQNRTLLEVRPQGLVMYSAGLLNRATALAAIRATTSGAFFAAASADGPWKTTLEASDKFNGIRIFEGEVPRVELGRKTSSGYSLKVESLSSLSDPIAGIGESLAGSGALIVGDATGHTRMSLTANKKPEVRVFTADGEAVVSLREAEEGSGLFVVGNVKGTPMAKLGINDNKYGTVLTGPRPIFPLVPKSMLPGSYFLGCAGGDGCAP